MLDVLFQGREDMKEMFRVCATERLFIPDMFPKLDKEHYQLRTGYSSCDIWSKTEGVRDYDFNYVAIKNHLA